MPCYSCLALMVVLVDPQVSTPDDTTKIKPVVLEAAEAARLALDTGVVRYAMEEQYVDPKLRSEGQYTFFLEARFGDDSSMTTNYGDKEGVRARFADGRPAIGGNTIGTSSQLFQDGKRYAHEEFMVDGEVEDFPSPEHPRTLGVNFDFGTDWDNPKYRQARDGNLHTVVVEGQTALGARKAEYIIDENRGFSIVGYRYFANGIQTEHVVIEPAKFGNHWYPGHLKMFRHRHGPDGKAAMLPFREITVSSAEFNEPTHQRRFTPNDIGLDAGMQIINSRSGESMFWTGESLITPREFGALARAGKIKPGPRLLALQERLRAIGDLWVLSPEAVKDPRDRYFFSIRWKGMVEEFISTYKCTDSQQTAAWGIYRDCVDRAIGYWKEHEREINSLLKTFNAHYAPSANATGNSKRPDIDALIARKEKLIAWFDELQKSAFVPRLEGLLTSEQKSLGQASASKQAPDKARR